MTDGATSPNQKIAAAISLADAAYQSLSAAMDQFAQITGPNGEKFSLDVALPGQSEQRTAREIGETVSVVIQLLRTLSSIPATAIIPDTDITDLSSRVAELKTNTDRLASTIKEFVGSGPTTSLDVTAFTALNAGGQSHDFSSLISALYRPAQALLSAIRRLFLDRDNTELRGLTETLAELNAIRSDQRTTMSEIAATEQSLAKTTEAVQQLLKQAQEDMKKISELSSQTPNVSEQLNKALQDATLQVQQVTVVGNQAKTLQQSVTSFQTEFEKFGAAMGLRQKQFEEGTLSFNTMLQDNASSKEELDRILIRARAVLGEATVAGLSDRFLNEATSLNRRLTWSLGLFFLGIALFLFSSGVVLDLFPWINKIVQVQYRMPPTAESGWPNFVYLVGSLLGKLIFLLPSLILIGFSAKWYAALFRLRKEYAYKYTVAASLPGFKIEAPQFAEALTAIAFQELMYNPQDSEVAGKATDAKSADVGNSFLQKLVDPLIKKSIDRVAAKLEGKGG